MFSGLTRPMRVLAGRLLVLAYLFCVLSPGAAIALGHGAAPCLDEAAVAVAISHLDAADDATMHAAHAHHHDHGHTADAGVQVPPVSTPAPSHHDHSKMSGPCCAMMCAVGLRAELPAVALPSAFAAASTLPRERSLTGRTLPRLDRPPIVLI